MSRLIRMVRFNPACRACKKGNHAACSDRFCECCGRGFG